MVAGVGVLVWHGQNPDTPQGRLGGISLGWFALVLGSYNLARWWNRKSYAQLRARERDEEEKRRQREATKKQADPDSPFRFEEQEAKSHPK